MWRGSGRGVEQGVAGLAARLRSGGVGQRSSMPPSNSAFERLHQRAASAKSGSPAGRRAAIRAGRRTSRTISVTPVVVWVMSSRASFAGPGVAAGEPAHRLVRTEVGRAKHEAGGAGQGGDALPGGGAGAAVGNHRAHHQAAHGVRHQMHWLTAGFGSAAIGLAIRQACRSGGDGLPPVVGKISTRWLRARNSTRGRRNRDQVDRLDIGLPHLTQAGALYDRAADASSRARQFRRAAAARRPWCRAAPPPAAGRAAGSGWAHGLAPARGFMRALAGQSRRRCRRAGSGRRAASPRFFVGEKRK